RPVRKPLVLFTPKSLLRLPEAFSPLAAFTAGGWNRVLDDPLAPQRAQRVVMCTGRVYYELARARHAAALEDAVALIRVEELYPFPEAQLQQVLAAYGAAEQFLWCQEEPQNQGAWFQVWHHLRHCLPRGGDVSYAGRPPSAAPASGYAALHQAQLDALLNAALGT
ncbi:MAG: 2-oxoglutarate dehydrogenase E1 component, partial [Steroidobacteraceae bacterium]